MDHREQCTISIPIVFLLLTLLIWSTLALLESSSLTMSGNPSLTAKISTVSPFCSQLENVLSKKKQTEKTIILQDMSHRNLFVGKVRRGNYMHTEKNY